MFVIVCRRFMFLFCRVCLQDGTWCSQGIPLKYFLRVFPQVRTIVITADMLPSRSIHKNYPLALTGKHLAYGIREVKALTSSHSAHRCRRAEQRRRWIPHGRWARSEARGGSAPGWWVISDMAASTAASSWAEAMDPDLCKCGWRSGRLVRQLYRNILPYSDKRKQVTNHPNLRNWCF